MAQSNELPTDNDGWFKRHIIEALNDLKKSHETILEGQQEMHEANLERMENIAKTIRDHDEADQKMFSSIREDVAALQPLQKIVYGAIALILVAFLTALITTVVVGQRPASSQIQQPGRN